MNKIFIASRYHKVVPLDGQQIPYHANSENYEENSVVQQSLGIRWQEKVSLHYLVTPLDEPCFTLSECDVLINHRSKSLSPSEVNSITDFICLEHAHEKYTVRVSRWKYVKIFSMR